MRYELKTPYNDGTTHVLFEPLDFISRLVALVPKPRVHLTRYHGVFAPHSKYRARVTAATAAMARLLPCRAPPAIGLFDCRNSPLTYLLFPTWERCGFFRPKRRN